MREDTLARRSPRDRLSWRDVRRGALRPVWTICLCLSALGMSGAGLAQSPPQAVDDERPPTIELRPRTRKPRKHPETGFLMHAEFGGAYGSLGIKLPGPASAVGLAFNEATFSGGALATGLSVGGLITPYIGLFVRLNTMRIFNPTATTNNPALGGHTSGDVGVTSLAVGPAIRLYAIPAHLYLMAGVGIAAASMTARSGDDGVMASSDPGFCAMGGIGAETWAGDNLRIGLLARAELASLPGGDGSELTTTSVAGLVTVAWVYGTE